jgi:hypothetical protein
VRPIEGFRGRRHFVRRACADGECCSKRLGPGKACQSPHGLAAALGFQIPKSTVERVAGTAWRQERAQLLPIDPAFDGRSRVGELTRNAFDRFIMIVDAAGLAASAQFTVAQRGDDDVRMGKDVIRDAERLVAWPLFRLDVER